MFVATVGAIALFAGLLLWLLTIAASRSRISGNGWSLSGNGALIVPFGIGPALIAGGWAAIILRLRGNRNWRGLALTATGIGVLLVVLSLLSLVVLGATSLGTRASVLFQLFSFLWLLAGPMIALLLPASVGSARRPLRWSVSAAVLLPIALLAGCQAGASLLPS
jgi:hypothetical protein